MTRGIIDDATLDAISSQLPDVLDLQRVVRLMAPDFISMKFQPESNIPVAAVCLRDAVNTLIEARYGLREASAHLLWYRNLDQVPSETSAVFFGRFYVDDAALRLYAAAEHIANSIIAMLEITEQQLEPHKGNRISQASIVGHFLIKDMPNHPIAQAVVNLLKSKEWQQAAEYRNKWVHEQPPGVEGLGAVWKRYKRWKKQEQEGAVRYMLGVGIGDDPEYAVDDVVKFTQQALHALYDFAAIVVEFYRDLLQQNGIVIDPDTFQVEVKVL